MQTFEAKTTETTVTPAPTFTVYNPATREQLAQVPIDDAAAVQAAVQAARLIQPAWAAETFQTRAAYLFKWRNLIMQHKAEIIKKVGQENGKPPTEVLVELAYLGDLITYYGKRAAKFLKDEKVSLHLYRNKSARIEYLPVGVVGVIAPWNFPLILGFGDVIPALLAGNAVVLKPSEVTPLGAAYLVELADQAGMPANVLQIVNGVAETATTLIDEADLIAFTGSVPTGQKVMERAAKTLTPVLLELGGKDPMIVLDDAPLDRAVAGAVNGAFFNAGQVCISVERLYVQEGIYEPFMQKFLEEVKRLRIGPVGGETAVDIGPLTVARQLEIVERQVEDAKAKGATILTGGSRLEQPGLFFPPTVITDVTDDMLVMQEETFGPVLPVIKVKDAEEAVKLANRSQFGLSSSLWTKNTEKANLLARRIQAGSTAINDVAVNYLTLELPLGGIKKSGIGYRHGGAAGIRHFCRTHSVMADRFLLKREQYWFPYNKTFEKAFGAVLNLLFKHKVK